MEAEVTGLWVVEDTEGAAILIVATVMVEEIAMVAVIAIVMAVVVITEEVTVEATTVGMVAAVEATKAEVTAGEIPGIVTEEKEDRDLEITQVGVMVSFHSFSQPKRVVGNRKKITD